MVRPETNVPEPVVRDLRCLCINFAPHIAWSPDGTTLAVGSEHHHPPTTHVGVDGLPVRVRFVAGASGPLTWQPR